MGFKEVMALRQARELEKALILAREDYSKNQDQWSASALFWVLKDLADDLIDTKETDKALPYILEMESLVGEMGATVNVATEALEKLQRMTIPHYNEIIELTNEIKKTTRRDRIRDIYATVTEWYNEDEKGIHSSLHDYFSEILVTYLGNQLGYIDYEEFEELNKLYHSLQNTRPSKVHSNYLELALEAKEKFENKMNLGDFLDDWDLVNLTPEDWNREETRFTSSRSLAERTLNATITEFLDLATPGKEVPAPIYQLLLDAVSFYPDDELVQLTQARIQMIEGNRERALEMYRKLLITLEEPRAWMEFATLIEDVDIKMGGLCMALRKEDDDYQGYLIITRLELTKILIQKKLYENALRELNIIAQISLEKAYELPEGYHELLKKIPNNTIADKNNREFYYPNSRPAQEYIYEPLPTRTMLVLDIIAIKLKDGNQVVPMLKLIDTEGSTALVSPKESGIIQGDNRGLCYEVKLLERPKRYNKVVLMTLSKEQEPKKIFPTMVGYINGYSQVQFAHHVMDTNSRHHYLPGSESDYMFGEFIEFIHILEFPVQKKRIKGRDNNPSPREYLLLPSRLDPLEAIKEFPSMSAEVVKVREEDYILITEKNIRSFVNHSVSPVALEEGDTVMVRGFQQRHKDRRTGEISYSFNTISIELPTNED